MSPLKKARTARRSEFKLGNARHLRNHATDAERQCWALLRSKKMADWRFRRQQPVGPYIVDFFCSAAKLIVELDGGPHHDLQNVIYDQLRTRWLEQRGYRVLRFDNYDFSKNRDRALERIWLEVQSRTPPRSAFGASTLPQGEGKNT